MTDPERERAILAIYDLRELDRQRDEMQRRWTDFVIAVMEIEFAVDAMEVELFGRGDAEPPTA